MDDWIKGDVRRRPLMKNIFVDFLLKVSDLIDFHNKCWKLSVFTRALRRRRYSKNLGDVNCVS